MVPVGLIGLGPVWETRYLPALQKLRKRIAVRALYDTVAMRAVQAAAELNATPASGILELVRRPDLKAILLLDAGWHGFEVFNLLKHGNKPVYIAGSLGEDTERLRRLNDELQAASLTFMPEFSLRYTPATARLQELLATRLGRPQQIRIEAVLPHPDDPDVIPGQGPGTDFLVGLLDWCGYVIRTAPVFVNAQAALPDEPAGTSRTIRIEFLPSRGNSERPVVELRIRAPHRDAAADQPHRGREVRHEIICERGHAQLSAAAEITWRNGTEAITESLLSERSDIEVMLDHFCRRVVGGLIPVADLADVCRCIALARAVEESLQTGRPVEINGSH